jgi:hypothetical protein
MSLSNEADIQLDEASSENVISKKTIEIEGLEKLIDDSLEEIKLLQGELIGLEADLNLFLDHYYGSGATFFQNNSVSEAANSPIIADLDKAKKDIYDKIARVCSKDVFHFEYDHISDVRSNLLKIEGYLTDGSESSESPQDILSALAVEYLSLIKQISTLKEQKQDILDSPAFELRQEVTWANIKKAEVISRIKNDLTHRVNRPS